MICTSVRGAIVSRPERTELQKGPRDNIKKDEVSTGKCGVSIPAIVDVCDGAMYIDGHRALSADEFCSIYDSSNLVDGYTVANSRYATCDRRRGLCGVHFFVHQSTSYGRQPCFQRISGYRVK